MAVFQRRQSKLHTLNFCDRDARVRCDSCPRAVADQQNLTPPEASSAVRAAPRAGTAPQRRRDHRRHRTRRAKSPRRASPRSCQPVLAPDPARDGRIAARPIAIGRAHLLCVLPQPSSHYPASFETRRLFPRAHNPRGCYHGAASLCDTGRNSTNRLPGAAVRVALSASCPDLFRASTPQCGQCR